MMLSPGPSEAPEELLDTCILTNDQQKATLLMDQTSHLIYVSKHFP